MAEQTSTFMPDAKAKDIISLRDREKSRQSNFRSLWQSVADLQFPQTYGITNKREAGRRLMTNLFDTTAVEESENMTSGLVVNLFPPGQKFFAITPAKEAELPHTKRYLSALTEVVHESMFNSNFLIQIANTIRYWLVFGTGANYSDWSPTTGLNYMDYSIGTYQCMEDHTGVINTIILTASMTARQIVEKWGEGAAKVGSSVWEAYTKIESRENEFDVIQIVRPRKDFNPNPLLRPANEMPFESIYVNEKDQKILEEGGYEDFPYAVPRYYVSYREVYGRGRGTALHPTVRVLNRLSKDYMEMSNKWVNPPREILESFEGNVDVTPGANNYVVETGSIVPINMGANGMYPVTKDILEYYREGVRQGYLKNAFEPITPLQGDRRNMMEISERLKEGMKKLAAPMGRLFNELLTPIISRSTFLLMRNGVVPPPPEELQGTPFKITFLNPLALALGDQQSRGLVNWVMAGAQMEPVFPGITDNVNIDIAYRDLGASYGVKTEHIKPIPERDEQRQMRAQQQQQMQQAELLSQGSEDYKNATKAPEPGSPAEALQEAMLGGA